MWCNILTKPKQGSVFRKFRVHLMNVPQDYDDEAERLRTHPLLLPKEEDSTKLSTADTIVFNKKTNKISFARDVKFTQRTLLGPNVPRINKKQNRGHLMNVPQDYDDEAQRLRTHPLLLPKEDGRFVILEKDIVVNFVGCQHAPAVRQW